MATAEPTHADDAEPGQEAGQRIRLRTRNVERPEPDEASDTSDASDSSGSAEAAENSGSAAELPDASAPPKSAENDTDSEDGEHRADPDGVHEATRLHRFLRHPATLATALSGILHVIWFFTFANSGGDLAAQDAWAEFVGRNPGSAYNLAWYGGCTRSRTAWCRRI